MRYFIFLIFLIAGAVKAQELNCKVQVLAPQVQGSERRVFETLQNAIFEFMNSTKWTEDAFTLDERIDCNIMINITRRNNDDFDANISVQARRPVYNTSYNSILCNIQDNDFSFRYMEYQPLEFSLNAYNSNLTSTLAFYAYFILGIDYDSFAMEGGSPHFLKAQQIVANAQTSAGMEEAGWKAHRSIKNRYWLIENMMHQTFAPIREATYVVHRKGLDNMTVNMEEAREEILKVLEKLRTVHKLKPTSYNMQVFFNAKADEMVSVFSKAMPDKKQKAVQVLSEVDPGNLGKYQKILSGN
jgi:hypothetical protein